MKILNFLIVDLIAFALVISLVNYNNKEAVEKAKAEASEQNIKFSTVSEIKSSISNIMVDYTDVINQSKENTESMKNQLRTLKGENQ